MARVPISFSSASRSVSGQGILVSQNGELRTTSAATSGPYQVCAPMWFTAMALTWRQTAGRIVEADVRTGEGLSSLGPETEIIGDLGEAPDVQSPEHRPSEAGTGLLWTGGARCISFSLRLPAGVAMSALKAVFINSSGTSEGPESAQAPGATGFMAGLFGGAAAEAKTKQPKMVTRKQWGADDSLINCHPGYAEGGVRMAFVHHTAGSNDYTAEESDDIMRGIYSYHTEGRGWCDIAYNFLVDKFGTVFIGRKGGITKPIIPAATQGFNTGSFAVSAMGDFMDVQPPKATVKAIQRVLAWRLDWAHVPPRGWAWMTSAGGSGNKYAEGTSVVLKVISGHRRTAYTDCPGDNLAKIMDKIRDGAERTGRPKIYRPKASAGSLTLGETDVRLTARSYTANYKDRLLWEVKILDSDGNVVRSWTPSGTSSSFDKTWKGWDNKGNDVAPGKYLVVMSGKTQDGKSARVAKLRVKVKEAS